MNGIVPNEHERHINIYTSDTFNMGIHLILVTKSVALSEVKELV